MAQHSGPVWGTLDPFVEGGPSSDARLPMPVSCGPCWKPILSWPIIFFWRTGKAARRCKTYVQSVCPQALGKIRILPRIALPEHLARTSYHAFHLSDCLTSQGFLAAVRNRLARDIFPITGVTHSLSYARYGQSFAQHVWSGTTARDCIVATSSAGADVVREELAALGEAYGAPVPQVAVGAPLACGALNLTLPFRRACQPCRSRRPSFPGAGTDQPVFQDGPSTPAACFSACAPRRDGA